MARVLTSAGCIRQKEQRLRSASPVKGRQPARVVTPWPILGAIDAPVGIALPIADDIGSAEWSRICVVNSHNHLRLRSVLRGHFPMLSFDACICSVDARVLDAWAAISGGAASKAFAARVEAVLCRAYDQRVVGDFVVLRPVMA